MNYPNEWTQKEFLENRIKLEKKGIQVVLVDTILSPIEKADTTVYNPHELKNYPDGTVFVADGQAHAIFKISAGGGDPKTFVTPETIKTANFYTFD